MEKLFRTAGCLLAVAAMAYAAHSAEPEKPQSDRQRNDSEPMGVKDQPTVGSKVTAIRSANPIPVASQPEPRHDLAIKQTQNDSKFANKDGSDDQWWRDPLVVAFFALWVTGGQLVVAFVALLIAGVQAILFIKQLKLMQPTIDAANNALKVSERLTVLTHPPRIQITNVAIWSGDDRNVPPILRPGERIQGIAFAVNIGASDANLEEKRNRCLFDWRRGTLPMWRPFNDRSQTEDNRLCIEPSWDVAKVLVPGQFAIWKISTTVPDDYDPSMSLYIFGQVFYLNTAGKQHARLFARRYDPEIQNFVTVKDRPDYEGEE
jgi:hypothetical protein